MEDAAGLAFRQLLFELSQKIRPEDAHNLGYVYQLQLERSGGERRGSETLDALVQLEQKGVFSGSKLEGLLSVLESIHRQDLVELVKNWAVRKAGRAHLRPSPPPAADVISGPSIAQEVAEYKVAVALAELLEAQTQKLRSYPHHAVNAKTLTTVIRKLGGVKELLLQVLPDSSTAVFAPAESGTYVYMTKSPPPSSAPVTRTIGQPTPHTATPLPRLPIPETAGQGGTLTDEEHVYATVPDLDILPLQDSNGSPMKELLDPSSLTTGAEFNRASLVRKPMRHYSPRSPLQSDSGSKFDEVDIMSDTTNPDSEANDDAILNIETIISPFTSQGKEQESLVPISATTDNKV